MESENRNQLMLGYDNPYWKADPEMFGRLYRLIYEHPAGSGMMLRSKRHADLAGWIGSAVPKLDDPAYGIQTKVTWILTGQTDFRRCANPRCGRYVEVGMNYSLAQRRRSYCCPACQKTSPLVNEKKRSAMLAHAAADPEYFQRLERRKKATKTAKGLPPNWCNHEKQRETIRRLTKTDPDFWKRRDAKSKLTRIRNGRPPNWTNAGKAAETRRAKNGGKYESDATRAKRRRTCLERYGRESPNQAEAVKDNKRKSCVERYGVDHPMKLDSTKRRLEDAVMRKYGVRHAMQLKSVQRRARKKYFYDGRYYSSSDEICFMIYNRDAGADVTYQPDTAFEYEFAGEKHTYHPDFEVNGRIVEIKGDQFFRPDGTMFCPFRKRGWTDEEYGRRCALEEAKHQCMVRNGVTVIRTKSEAMARMREYVAERYGKGYVGGFRTDRRDTPRERGKTP